ncbi:hypothetical protein E8E13_006314 [Curvularia kusanoi]|uniref:Uncharacterized protein n=1 Tax=Curvularia kusanoi TaxID=90978 RepID=A0A9P4TJS6_CURKU|nr:hypothetical protein E8E13_006314 [Curvularia kusanoi]
MASKSLTQSLDNTVLTTTTLSEIRDAMSLSHLLVENFEPRSPAPKPPAEDFHATPPLVPERSVSPAKDDFTCQADTTMSELEEQADVTEASDQVAAMFIDDDAIEREFTCVNDEYSKCRTGQYTMALSRKVISDHFGRNKSCTRSVSEWPLFCRKHYQRATYNKDAWQIRKVRLILRQFDIIEGEYPGTTYDITLKRAEEDRLNEFSRKVAGGASLRDAAKAVAPMPGKAFEAPIDILRELDQYLGKGKTLQQAKDTMDVIHQMLQGKETEQVPSIEFLPQLPGKTPTPKSSPTKTRLTKSPSKSPSKGSPRTPRTSARGGVKKPLQKA